MPTFLHQRTRFAAGGICLSSPAINGPLFDLWVYHESNGIPGLQRGDEVVDDTCHESIRSDTIVF